MYRTLRFAFMAMLTLPCTSLIAQDPPSIKELTEQQATLITEQAAALDAAPRLAPGANEFEAAAMATGFIAWVEVPEDGIYQIKLDGPGALVLASFPTPDGGYDGQTGPRRHGSDASLQHPVAIGPVLLSASHPYMISIGSATATTVSLETILAAGDARPAPTEETVVSDGDHLFLATGRFDLQLEPNPVPRSVQVIGEARSDVNAQLGRMKVRTGGLAPWLTESPERLRIDADVPEGTPPARILVRIAPFEGNLDETEPNDQIPDPFLIGQDWRGLLLPSGDDDVLGFAVPEDGDYALSVSTGLDWARFTADLRRSEDRRSVLWQRERRGELDNEPLRLTAGDYELELERVDGREVQVPYTVSLNPGVAPNPGEEIEPNDNEASAMRLPESLQVGGSAAEDDVDFYSFSVPDAKAGHLWRLFAIDANRIELYGQDGRIVRVDGKERRMRADSLALDPGDYVVKMRAAGDYVLRVMDLGDRPQGYEAEPNDNANTGQRLEFGEAAQGGFHVARDVDVYLFRLEAPSPVEIKIVPSGDGKTDAKLYHSGTQRGGRVAFTPESGPMTFRSKLPAGDWAIELRSLDQTVQETYIVTVRRLPALADGEPDDDPLLAAKLPRNGDWSGSVGGFDGADQVFMALPQGSGSAAVFCDQPAGLDVGRWRVFDWSTGDSLGDIRDGVLVFPYTPSLGGAVRLELLGGADAVPYRCRARFASDEFVTAEATSPDTSLLPTTAMRSFELSEATGEQRIPLALDADEVGLLSCRTADGSAIPADQRLWQTEDAKTISREPLGDFEVLRAGSEPILELDPRYADSLPVSIQCTLLAVDDLPRPRDMGPPAEFRLLSTADTATTADPAIPGPPPPGLEALINRPQLDEQPKGDLPVRIAFEPLPTLAGYAEVGQSFSVDATLTNESSDALDLSLSVDIPASGWRIESLPKISLSAGASETMAVSITAPPWISPVLRPTLAIRAHGEQRFAAAMAELQIDPQAMPIGPVTYWHAPDALRGGLNVLHHGLGARLIEIDGEATDERKQATEESLHDGLAPHIAGQNARKDLVFRLAAQSELAGGMIQLRSTTSPDRWPSGVEFFVPSADESGWQRVAAGELATEHAPQYFVFDPPVTTDRLRVRFPDCHAPCSQVYLQEIQAIAVPGDHPEDLPPINAANPALGGHVVFANPGYMGSWNESFLEAHPTSSNQGWFTRESERSFVVGFHQNRAARLQAVAWIGDPEDGGRVPEAGIEASIVSPAGPWTALDALPSPPEGELRSVLEFNPPVWARYLRVTLPMGGEERRVGPDALQAIEASGRSVLALWEDDQPAASYEAENAENILAAVPPAGGPNRESAVQIKTGSATMSSVLIERNEDWWRLSVPGDLPQDLTLDFGPRPPAVATNMLDENGRPIALKSSGSGRRLDARLAPGDYFLRIHEPPRSVVIAWDTSGSVAAYRDRTLAAVRTWARSLQPGRDALQLLPFRPDGFILDDWAEHPEDVEPALRELPEEQSSASETAMMMAADALADRQGARGIVIITDAETGMEPNLWPAMIGAMPRVVSLSIDSNSRQNAAIMMDWAALNGGRFRRVIGPLGLADGMDMASALFRAPKAYEMTATLTELVEPEGEASLVIAPSAADDATPVGAVELILDASGSMLQRMEGRRRIDIAHDALERLVSETLPEGTPFAFRAFGLEADACRTELVVPLGPLDRKDAARKISGVPAVNLAKTAIADSLHAAREDLAATAPPRVVVLVTDGEETCGGDPEAAIAELRESGLDARINIVGFAIDDAELIETFAGWADAGGGTYFNADSAEALETSIAEALKPKFEIVKIFLDGRTEIVGNVALGEPVVVPAGRLRIKPASGAVGDALDLDIAPNDNVQLDYRPTSGLSPAALSPTDSEFEGKP